MGNLRKSMQASKQAADRKVVEANDGGSSPKGILGTIGTSTPKAPKKRSLIGILGAINKDDTLG
jgi:hypothetical protein